MRLVRLRGRLRSSRRELKAERERCGKLQSAAAALGADLRSATETIRSLEKRMSKQAAQQAAAAAEAARKHAENMVESSRLAAAELAEAACVSSFSLQRLARCIDLIPPRSTADGKPVPTTIYAIGAAACGRKGYAAAWFGLVAMTLGVCGSYFVFVASTLAELCGSITPHSSLLRCAPHLSHRIRTPQPHASQPERVSHSGGWSGDAHPECGDHRDRRHLWWYPGWGHWDRVGRSALLRATAVGSCPLGRGSQVK